MLATDCPKKDRLEPEFVVGMRVGAAALFLLACSCGSGQSPGQGSAATGSGSGGGHSGAAAAGGSGSPASSGATGATADGSAGSGDMASSGSGAAGFDASSTSDATVATTGSSSAGDGASGAAGPDSAAGGDSSGGPPVIDLFNGTDLTGFNTYQQTTKTTPGTLVPAAAAQLIFKPENGMIHVYGDLPNQSTQSLYTLETVAAYGKYNLSWDYKWGTKKFAPYTNLTLYPRDAGLIWHIHGDPTQVWPSSIEFQNKWGTTGDIFALYAQCTSLALPGAPTVFADTAAGGVPTLVNGSTGFVQHLRSANWESMGTGAGASTGVGTDWNSCLLQVDGGTAVYTVNGHVVNRVLKVMDKSGNPITSGKVAWQAESAEVYYRNLRIQVLP